MGELIVFYTVAAVIVLSALTVIWARSPLTALLSLLVTMCGIAALFVLLGAVFLAALQLLIYAGAVLVLFLFVVMLLNLDAQALKRAKQFAGRWLTVGLGVVLFTQLRWLWRVPAASMPLPAAEPAASPEAFGTMAHVGRVLFREYWLPFELTSLLIVAAIVGAVALAQRKSS